MTDRPRTRGQGADRGWPIARALGSAWIASAARAADVSRGPELVGHTDWAAKHLRFDEQLRPTALYDWDSVTTGTETMFVGTADGVYLSQASMRTFIDWSEGLPAARRIVALGAVDNAVYGITFGGEIWRRAYPE